MRHAVERWLGVLALVACTSRSTELPEPAGARVAPPAIESSAKPATPPRPRDAGLPDFGTPAPQHDAEQVRLVFWLEADASLGGHPRDEPHLIAYASGRVVYRRERESWFDWYEVTLPPAELDALVEGIAGEGLASMEAVAWCIPGWWSLPLTRIAVRDGDEWMMRQVVDVRTCEIIEAAGATTPKEAMEAVAQHYGFEDESEDGRVVVLDLPDVMYEYDRERAKRWPIRTSMPPAFATAYHELRDWSHPDAVPFEPESFELELYRANPGTNGGDAGWPYGLPEPARQNMATKHFRHRVNGKYYRYASPLEPADNTMRFNRMFDERVWQVFVQRDFPEQSFIDDTEALANEVACAWDMRQRMQCTLDHPNMKEEWRTKCAELMRPATEVGHCRANRMLWRRQCSDTMYKRCGW